MKQLERIGSKDVLTPANAITAFGLLLVIIGSFFLYKPLGLALITLGRLMDLIDGPVARATKTTRFSVVFDPFADKIALAAILISVYVYELAPLAVVIYIVLQNLATTVLAFRAYGHNGTIGATIPGKLNMFFQTMTILLFIASSMTPSGLSALLMVFAYANLITSLPLALITLGNYRFRLLHKRSRHSTTIDI